MPYWFLSENGKRKRKKQSEMKILVVDDHPLIVEDIIDELKGIVPDAEMMGTSNSLEVSELCDRHHFDVIFMDIDMPGINGLDLAKEIQKKYPRTNIIYVTGHEKYALESYKTWASAFLVKPVSTERLRSAMNNLRYPISSISEEMIREQYAGSAAIGARIKMYREKRNMSRNEMASLMNVSVQSVYRWESGERVPDVATLMQIAKHLGINIDALTGSE